MTHLTPFPLPLDRERVFAKISLRPDSPAWEDALADYRLAEPQFADCVRFAAGYSLGPVDAGLDFPVPCGRRVFAAYTIGPDITRLIQDCFDQGEFLRGMLLDAMADQALGLIETAFTGRLEAQGLRLTRRFWPIHDISPAYQRLILAEVDIGVTMTEGFMLNPVKSGSFVAGIIS